MNQRIVSWIGEIGTENLKLVSSKIYDFWLEDNEKIIDVFVASWGGSLDIAFGFYDMTKIVLRASLRTTAIGAVDSSAIIVFVSGKERLITENATMLFHEIRRTYEKETVMTASAVNVLNEDLKRWHLNTSI